MINVSELITDRDFAQPDGISITRYEAYVENHKTLYKETSVNVEGIVILLEANSDDLLDQYDRNSETLTLLTKQRLKCTGNDKINGNYYGSDIVHYKGANYIVRECQDLSEYGYCRSKAVKLEQDVM